MACKKLLSIIVPSYNMEAYLSKGLGSLIVDDKVLLQKLDIIVVNDGSNDRTSEIAHGFETKYPGVFRVIDKENGNYGSCVNAGLAIMQGIYVKILDADDTYDTKAFRRYLEFLEKMIDSGDGCDVVFNDFLTVDPEGNVRDRTSYAFTGSPSFTLAEFDYDTKPMVWAPALAYRAQLLRTIRYRQSEKLFYTDQEWDTIPMLAVRTVQYCGECVYRYLIGRENQSCNDVVRLRNFAMHFPVAEKIVETYVANKKVSPVANLCLVENQIKMHIRLFYSTYLRWHHSTLDDGPLIAYDKFLKNADAEIYQYADSVSAGNFRYVAEWRRKYSRATFKFMIFDLMNICKRIVGKIISKCRNSIMR